jgi:hypothetical protein
VPGSVSDLCPDGHTDAEVYTFFTSNGSEAPGTAFYVLFD